MDLFIKMFRALKNGKNHYCHITTNHLFVHDPCEKVGGRYTERVTFPAQVHEDTLDTSHALYQNRTGEEPVTVIRSDFIISVQNGNKLEPFQNHEVPVIIYPLEGFPIFKIFWERRGLDLWEKRR